MRDCTQRRCVKEQVPLVSGLFGGQLPKIHSARSQNRSNMGKTIWIKLPRSDIHARAEPSVAFPPPSHSEMLKCIGEVMDGA
jgi:hypothetical protein